MNFFLAQRNFCPQVGQNRELISLPLPPQHQPLAYIFSAHPGIPEPRSLGRSALLPAGQCGRNKIIKYRSPSFGIWSTPGASFYVYFRPPGYLSAHYSPVPRGKTPANIFPGTRGKPGKAVPGASPADKVYFTRAAGVKRGIALLVGFGRPAAGSGRSCVCTAIWGEGYMSIGGSEGHRPRRVRAPERSNADVVRAVVYLPRCPKNFPLRRLNVKVSTWIRPQVDWVGELLMRPASFRLWCAPRMSARRQ